MTDTLVFCTAYAESEDVWLLRYRIWLNAILAGRIAWTHILLVDDGSPILPHWTDVDICTDLQNNVPRNTVTLYHFRNRLGRQAVSIYPGWFRSFCFAARFAEKYGFEKIIHIESDAFIISGRMAEFMNSVNDGWIAPEIQSHAMPESAIQIIAGESLAAYLTFTRTPYSTIVGLEAENAIPFTKIERGFVGSRYGETLDYVPKDADFVTQINPGMRKDPNYFWWLERKLLPY